MNASTPEIPAEIAPGAIPTHRAPAPALGGAFSEPSGQISSYRIAFLFVLFVVSVVWAILCLREGRMIELPQSIALSLAALASGKVIQRFAEGQRR